MPEKRVHEIAKEQGLPSAEVLVKLRAAGFDVTAAQSVVDADSAVAALKRSNGDATPAPRRTAPGGALTGVAVRASVARLGQGPGPSV